MNGFLLVPLIRAHRYVIAANAVCALPLIPGIKTKLRQSPIETKSHWTEFHSPANYSGKKIIEWS
jgi:hypothetical protein